MRLTKKYYAIALLSLIAIAVISCSQYSSSPTQPMLLASSANPQTPGQATILDRPELHQAYYDSMLFTITLVPMPPPADSAILYHNGQINQIYMSEPGDTASVFVIDAIPSDGMNPMWREFEIHFNAGFTPHQFFSDNQVNDAAAGPNPEITLVATNEIYRCSVVGHKP